MQSLRQLERSRILVRVDLFGDICYLGHEMLRESCHGMVLWKLKIGPVCFRISILHVGYFWTLCRGYQGILNNSENFPGCAF